MIKARNSKDFISKVEHPIPTSSGHGLKERIESMLMAPMDVNRCLWDLQLSSGDLGSSGALVRTGEKCLTYDVAMTRESLLLFRVHHSLCDAVSLSVAMGDLADESKQLKEKIPWKYLIDCTQQRHKRYLLLLLLYKKRKKMLKYRN